MTSVEEKKSNANKRNQRWKANNPERAKEIAREATRSWRAKNPERAREFSKSYREKRIEKAREEWRSWYKKNRDVMLQRRKERRAGSPDKKVRYLLSLAKCRASKKGMAFDVELSDLEIPTHCPLLGVELSYSSEGKHSTNSASIDRIDSSAGYIRGNVWIVSRRANCIKNDASVEELRMILSNLEAEISRHNDE